LKEEEIAKRQKEGAHIKELESALEERSARMAQMMEDHKVELKKKNEKEEDLDKNMELLTAELEGKNQEMKDLEKEVKLRTAELEGKNQKMKDLTDENTAQAKEIEDLKQQLKELEETQRKREKERGLDPEQVKSKLQHAEKTLSDEDKKSLDAIQKNNLVEVDYKEASFKLKDNIGFWPIHHGADPVATFKNQTAALAVLRDVAALLKIFKTVQVAIQGHTATPPGKIDDWAHKLAENRAKAVMQQIVTNGVEESRLSAKGLPGNLGSGITEVLIKVVEL